MRSNNGMEAFASLSRTANPLRALAAVHAGRYVHDDDRGYSVGCDVIDGGIGDGDS